MRKKIFEPPGYRRIFFRLVHHVYFENFITAMVFLNTVCMSIVHYKMDMTAKYTLKMMNYFFSLVFNLEMFLKLIALKNEYF